MKDLWKIYRRYISTAAFISIFIIVFNLLLFFGFLVRQLMYQSEPDYLNWRTSSLAGALVKDGDSYTLPEDACERIDSDYAFAMLIDQQGQVIWSRNLPEEIPLSYTLTEVASFTRWYLKDYPVKVWEHPDGLFIAATAKDSLWKHGIEFKLSFISAIPAYLLALFAGNLILIFLLALLFGHRFYTSLKPLANGIENLSGQEVLHLPERGLVSGLARKLNDASEILARQRLALEKRDNARTSWIAGVSHDIRTPLSLIMGHADSLERNPNLNAEEHTEAASIKENSLHIKNLISDLNLTSKLEYDSYPLRLKEYAPAALIRSLAAYYINNRLDESYCLNPEIDAGLEGVTLTGDTDLLLRAFRNLTDNSIRHNPDGCSISIHACLQDNHVQIHFSDTGKGIPVKVIKALYRTDAQPSDANAPHIMGLRIVRQIAEAHHGWVEFELQQSLCHNVIIHLPLPDA